MASEEIIEISSESDDNGITKLHEKNIQNLKIDISVQKESNTTDECFIQNYSTLVNMFPNVDKNYIREICIRPPFQKIYEDILGMLINHLLGYSSQIENQNNDEFMQQKNDKKLSEMMQIDEIRLMEEQKQNNDIENEQLFSEFIKKDGEIIDEKVKILESIFPDACPNALKKIVEENNGDNIINLSQQVEMLLEDRNYEKRNHYFAEKRRTEKISEYTNLFNVEKFVKEFPDPFSHFEDAKRKDTFKNTALKYLQHKYIIYPNEYIKSIYTTYNNNLSLADLKLQESCDKLIEYDVHIQPEILENDLLLLQEIAFIQNKTLIKNYLFQKKKKDEEEKKIFRAQKILLTCECCYDELKPTEGIECGSGSHIFCEECVIRGTNTAIANGEGAVLCFMGCKKEIPLNILNKVLPHHSLEALIKKKQEIEVLQAQLDISSCPFCSFVMELSPEIIVFTCLNPECMIISCRKCKKKNHLPTTCENVLTEEKARLMVEEEMSNTIIRKCYRCGKAFIKEYGCNKMTCNCGALMCYICKQPINGYDHFDHENKCKTNQNSAQYDAEQLQLKVTETISKIKKDNPDLEIPTI